MNNIASSSSKDVSDKDALCLACSALAGVFVCVFALDDAVALRNRFDFGRPLFFRFSDQAVVTTHLV